MEIVSYKHAVENNITRYYTGRMCKHGHISERYTKGRRCVMCDTLTSSNWRKAHPESHRLNAEQWRLANPEKTKEINAKAYNKAMKENVTYKLANNLRKRFHSALKNEAKQGSAVRDLGCSVEFLKSYLEDKFYDDITWENHGKVWEIDHIIPLMLFDLQDIEQAKQVCHYTNLQPLTKKDHKIKSALERNKDYNTNIIKG